MTASPPSLLPALRAAPLPRARRRLGLVLGVATSLCVGATPAGTAFGQPAPSGPRAVIAPDRARSDLTAMYAGLQSAHVDLYAFTPKAQLDRAYRTTLRELDRPLTRGELALRLQTFAAKVRSGHTRIEPAGEAWRAYRDAGGKAFPLVVRVVGERVYVARNLSGLSTIAHGDELLQLNGRPIGEWVARATRHVSAETPYMARSFLEYRFGELLWQEVGAVPSFALRLRRRGQALGVRVPALTSAQMDAFGAALPPGLVLDWRRTARVEGRVGYLRPGPFFNPEAKSEATMYLDGGFRQFIDDAFASFISADVPSVLIDVRANPGGDNSFSDHMVAWFATRPFRFVSKFEVRVSPEAIAANRDRLEQDPGNAISRKFAELYAGARPGALVNFEIPEVRPREGPRFAGAVYLLVDRKSYSNTAALAAMVQDYKFATVLGEPTSELVSGTAGMEMFTLPASGLKATFTKARFVRPNGDPRPSGVVPDVVLPSPVVQTPADEVLQAALRIVRQRSDRASVGQPPPRSGVR